MAKVHKQLTPEEVNTGIALKDPLLFSLLFYGDEISKPPSKEQKLMILDQSKRVQYCTGRKIWKSGVQDAGTAQSLITHYRDDGGLDEAMLVTPAQKPLDQWMDRFERRIKGKPILNSLIRIQRGENTKLTSKYLTVYCRIEGHDGKITNMVGPRAIWIRGDEMQLGNEACHRARLQTILPGGRLIMSGVPDGVRDRPFYRIDQTNEGRRWSRHKYNSFINPIFEAEESRTQLEDDYGGKESQGYINNVLGEWGDEVLSSFPPGSIAVRNVPYYTKRLFSLSSTEDMENLGLVLAIPSRRCKQFAIGMDYGYSPDPSVIIGAYRDGEDDVWQVYCKVELYRVAPPHQRAIVRYIKNHVFSGEWIGCSSDNNAEIQNMQSEDKDNAEKYVVAKLGGSTPLALRNPDGTDGDAKVRNKQFYTELLKSWMINAVCDISGRKLYLGRDDDLVGNLLSTTERKTPAGYTVYFGKPNPDIKGGFLDHDVDGLRMLCYTIWLALADGAEITSEEELLAACGWAGPTGSDGQKPGDGWKAPWGE